MIKSVIKDYAGLTPDASNRLLGCPVLRSLSDGSASDLRLDNTQGKRRKVDLPNLWNPEQTILHPKNQNQTVVTPLVYHLSQGLFHEVPYQVDFGRQDWKHLQRGSRQEAGFVDCLLKKFCLSKRLVKLDGLHRISRGNFFSKGQIDNESYNVSLKIRLSACHFFLAEYTN